MKQGSARTVFVSLAERSGLVEALVFIYLGRPRTRCRSAARPVWPRLQAGQAAAPGARDPGVDGVGLAHAAGAAARPTRSGRGGARSIGLRALVPMAAAGRARDQLLVRDPGSIAQEGARQASPRAHWRPTGVGVEAGQETDAGEAAASLKGFQTA